MRLDLCPQDADVPGEGADRIAAEIRLRDSQIGSVLLTVDADERHAETAAEEQQRRDNPQQMAGPV